MLIIAVDPNNLNTSYMEKFNELKALIDSVEQDAIKFFEKGNYAAGTRTRTGLQKVKTLAQDIRNAVTAAKNAK